MWDQIAKHIAEITGEKFQIQNRQSVGGGCINQGYAIASRQQTYFIKLNRAADAEMFEAEAEGLQQMWDTHTIRVPRPICWGAEGESAYIVLEWLDLNGRGSDRAAAEMGRQLAAMHRQSLGTQFGWDMNNTIGSTPQMNPWTSNWAEFWTTHRIGYQLQLAQRKGGHFTHSDRLLAAIPEILADHHPQPSLVHGDLWGGNAAVTATGEPVIFDPATYYGDREVDIAMTELFGGFSSAFYQGYNEVWPLEPGYQKRKTLYNLYHILNHFNLFGGSYAAQANRMIQDLLS